MEPFFFSFGFNSNRVYIVPARHHSGPLTGTHIVSTIQSLTCDLRIRSRGLKGEK